MLHWLNCFNFSITSFDYFIRFLMTNNLLFNFCVLNSLLTCFDNSAEWIKFPKTVPLQPTSSSFVSPRAVGKGGSGTFMHAWAPMLMWLRTHVHKWGHEHASSTNGAASAGSRLVARLAPVQGRVSTRAHVCMLVSHSHGTVTKRPWSSSRPWSGSRPRPIGWGPLS